MITPIQNESTLQSAVWEIVHRTPVTDIHTHIYSLRFEDLLLGGIDELLTYHYLTAEVFRYAPMPYKTWWAMEKRDQADYIWHHVFLQHSPVSEAARGVLTCLGLLGLDPGSRDLNGYRAYFDSLSPAAHVDIVFERANVERVVMTNDPFDALERPVWLDAESGAAAVGDGRFLAALRIDKLLVDWKGAAQALEEWGYAVKASCDKASRKEVCRFLEDWIDRMQPLYMAMSLPPDFDPFGKSNGSKVFRDCVLAVAEARKIPVAMMIGVKKLVNPNLRLAGDSVGKASIEAVEQLCVRHPKVKFLVTMLSRENQHELCIAARKFHNLHLFGCWWFLNDPETITEMTNMRLELLGLSFTPQHSDARILDQLLYKWAHSRWLIGQCLQKKYSDLWRTGWRATVAEIERDVTGLFGGNFREFLQREL